jgi:hypothetical protein
MMMIIIIIIIVVGYRGLDLFACSFFRNYFSETYESIGQLVGLLGWGIGQKQGLYLHAGEHNTEKRGHTSMPGVVLEPTIPAAEESTCFGPLDHWKRRLLLVMVLVVMTTAMMMMITTIITTED